MLLQSQDALSRTARRAWAAAVHLVPTGNSLSPASWRRRHDGICLLLAAHVVVLPIFGISQGYPVGQTFGEGVAALGLLTILARWRVLPQGGRAVVATVGLMAASAIVVHMAGGIGEAHFHFFVMVIVASLYLSWWPFLTALAMILAHHGGLGVLAPDAIYNHPAAIAHPWRWALVHAGYVAAASVACLVAWRLNEAALAGERQARETLERTSNDLATAQRVAQVGNWIWYTATGKVSCSEQLFAIHGLEPVANPTLRTFFAVIHPEDRERVVALLAHAVREEGEFDTEWRIIRGDGETRTIHAIGHRVVGVDGNHARIFGTVQDITERKRLEGEVEHRALHDGLTGLANRTRFRDQVAHAIGRRHHSRGPVFVLYLDIDDFKLVNDTLGHSVGDDLLVAVGRRLRSAVRDGDVVARLGGDEFAILLDCDGHTKAVEAAKRVLAHLHDPIRARGSTIKVRASLGIAGSDLASDVDDLLRHADIAMYAAKGAGKGTHCTFHPDMTDLLTSRVALEAELEAALASDQLVLHYQPIIDLESGRLDAVEALVRWDHPERGLLPPGEFIALAEQTGQITELGSWVIREATRQAAMFQRTLGQPVSINVNLAAPQLETDLVGTVFDALHRAELDPALLTLEITETCLMSHESPAVDRLRALRELGVRIAIDDFGTGYSSLGYLQRLPIDTLKIDRSFVRSIAEGAEESALAQAIIKLGRSFGMRTVAEGIETTQQLSVLDQLGCDMGQGYLYSRPVPADELIADPRWSVLPAASPATNGHAPTHPPAQAHADLT